MRSRRFLVAGFGVLAFTSAGAAISACVADDPIVPIISQQDAGNSETSTNPTPTPTATGTSTTPPGTPLLAKGIACKAGPDCESGHCADGVCCESTCEGTCERCDIKGSIGSCSAVADGEDPDKECPTTPLADAGAPVDVTDAGEGDAAADDAGPSFNYPDGGLPPVNDNMCAGHCDGKRACSYKGKETTCGAAFCGSNTQQGRASCDGKGRCLYGVEECSAYACPDGSAGCKATCNSPNDCLATHYCDGATTTCKPRLGNGILCVGSDQCTSGVCDKSDGSGICCDTDCSGVLGGTCKKSGSIGKCSCSACQDGPCALYYKDDDNDKHGDRNGTIGNLGAKYACAAGPAPAGFVTSHDDCFDSTISIAASVHPGQTGYFASAYTIPGEQPSHDYNCSGAIEKETFEGPCGFCRSQFGVLQEGPDESEELSSQPEGLVACTLSFAPTCTSTGSTPYRRCGCSGTNLPSFSTAIKCGDSGTLTLCAKCTSAGGNGVSSSTGAGGSKVQRCR